MGSADDLAACRRLLRDGSRTFLAASRLLPRDVADAASALYAFCRVADDRIDLDAGAGGLRELDDRLGRIYAGDPLPVAADRAFAAVVARHRVPEAWPRALLEGFAWDLERRRYDDLAALRDYAARVAGSVGAMMARVMGVSSRAALARACELGIAMQLTNIARDVGEDARAGRLYLPQRWLREAGVDPDAWLARPRFAPPVATVVRRLLVVADGHYRGALAGIAELPPACRPGIRAAGLLYREIGRAVARRGFDSVGARATVGAARKVGVVAAALVSPGAARRAAAPAAPAQIDFLVAGFADVAPATRRSPPTAATAVLHLFERLERRDRATNLAEQP